MFKFILFLYDSARFFLLTFLLAGAQLNIRDSYFVPGLPYAAPLALFPLMAFFLWLDNKKYRPFAWLYAAGKITSVCAALTSAIPALKGFEAGFSLPDAGGIFVNHIIPVLALPDFIFLIPIVVSLKNED
jgi:hypothetical protein